MHEVIRGRFENQRELMSETYPDVGANAGLIADAVLFSAMEVCDQLRLTQQQLADVVSELRRLESEQL